MVSKREAAIKPSLGDKIFDAVNTALLILVLVIVLYPLYFVLIASLSDSSAVLNGEVWLWPKDITFTGYEKIFKNKDLLVGYANTILYTVLGTSINLAMTVMAAYPLSRRDLYGRNSLMAMFVFTMFFSGGLIPTYLLVKNLGMINTVWAMVLPSAVSVYNIIIMRTFFQTTIPVEIQESASIDGCSNLQILFRIVLPLSAPIIAVMVLFYAVGHWNSYFNALIYLTDRGKFPLQLYLREILIQGQANQLLEGTDELAHVSKVMESETIKYAVVLFANLPVLLLYPFLQKYFVKGMVIGAIKG